MTPLVDTLASDPARVVRPPAMTALVEAAQRVDVSFASHAANVTSMSVSIGRALSLSTRALRGLELAAALHDIGKARVPAAILAKPGPLDDAEWTCVREHPVEGERLLAGHVPAGVLRIVRSHHERWDGGGYPDGLRGTQIPLGARIVAVADAFAAMVEHRPYRDPRSVADAAAELQRESGRQFDPTCVRAASSLTARRS